MNGQVAVDKWKQGGYHLVLMDIQMPVMNGLQATKEIRRLERVNGVGVFSAEDGSPVAESKEKEGKEDEAVDGEPNGDETQPNGTTNGTDTKDKGKVHALNPDALSTTNNSTTATAAGGHTQQTLFKSPVIIVALTASSLQSDRHEALAAGCNDFLTKPVNFVWLERKVKEWGCMQALIDFDGWRAWRERAEGEAGK